MPIPPPPGGPPSPPTFSQASSAPPLLSAEEAPDRHPLLSDLLLSSRLRTVSLVNERSAPMLDSKSQTQTDHPYIRLYQYLQQPHGQQGAPENTRTTFELEMPKRGGAAGANGSAAGSPSGAAPPIGGLFPGGAPKLRAVGDGSSGRSPSSRSAAPRPPSHRHDDAESPSPQTLSPLETSRTQPFSLPILTPPPPLCRRGNAPSPPSSNNREKTLPPTNTPPIPSKPPPSPGNSRRPPTSGGNPAPSSSLAPPPDLPQRHNSLNNKRPAPSPGGHTPTRGPAPPPPPSPSPNRPPPPSRETAGKGAAPPVPAQPSAASLRGVAREAPPPPPYRTHGSPSPSCDPPSRGKPPPPPPPLRNGTSSSPSVPRSFVDDFESKYSFHPLDDFPPPEEYRHFTKIYPSKANRVMRGAPPLPPVGR